MTAPGLLPLRPGFLQRLAAASAAAAPLLSGSAAGATVAGAPEEFEGYRPYLPGDDIRGIDWNLFARSGELFLKLFRFEEEVEVVLLVDESPSMLAGEGGKYDVAAAAAAALAYLGFLTMHPVTLVRYAGQALELSGPHRHLDAFPLLSRRLASPVGGSGTSLGAGLEPLLRRQRPMTFLALTDGFQHEPLARVAARVGAVRHARLVVILVEEERDRRPPLRGNLLIRDDESGEAVAVLSDRGLERELHRGLEAHFAALGRELSRRGALVLSLPARPPFEERFLDLLRPGGPRGRG
jgi:uncharacterized protein (DUF58 family)